MFRLLIFFGAIIASYVGSLQFRSTDPAALMTGGLILVVATFLLFYFTRKIWRFIGCFPALMLILLFVGALLFTVSGGQIWDNITGQAKQTVAKTASAVKEQMKQNAAAEQQQAQSPEQQNGQQQQQPQQPPQPQVFEGHIQTINGGDSFVLNGIPFRLYALAAPVIAQKCKDRHGIEYNCGYLAARKLKDFIGTDSVSCRVMSQNPKGELMGACNVGGFDIGAAMVEAGWAVALPQVAPVYIPYEQKARQNHEGMWSGTFKMPWEWEAEQMQIQRDLNAVEVPNIKVKRKPQKKKGSSVFDFF